MIKQTRLMFSLFLLAFSSIVAGAEIWYEDNSFAKPRTLPENFVYSFQHPDSWADTRKRLSVYMFRVNIFNISNFPEITDEFITNHMIPVLKEGNIKVALDTGSAMLSGCIDISARTDKEFQWISRIKRLGMDVSYINLQSILTKRRHTFRAGGENEEVSCSLEDRVKGAIKYAQRFAQIYPKAQIGFTDDLPSHGKPYEEAYRFTREEFINHGVPIAFIQLDVPAEFIFKRRNGMSWEKVGEVGQYIRKLDMKFGLLIASRAAGYKSDRAYYETITDELGEYHRHQINADQLIITSWFPYPRKSVKRFGDVDQYSITDVINEFFEPKDRLPQGGN